MTEGNGKTPPKSLRLHANDLAPTDHVQQFLTAQPSEGTNREDVLKPEFWTHVARGIKSGTELRVIPKGGAWYGRYLVTFADQAQVRLKELEYVLLDETPPDVVNSDGKFEVKWAGPVALWRIIRKEDKHLMREKMASRQEAYNWMNTNLRA